jgi:hypothetical protein
MFWKLVQKFQRQIETVCRNQTLKNQKLKPKLENENVKDQDCRTLWNQISSFSRLRRQIRIFLILVKSSRSFQIVCRTLFNRFSNRSHKLTFLEGHWGFCGPSELCAGPLSFLWAHWAFCGAKSHDSFRLQRQISIFGFQLFVFSSHFEF